MGLTKLVEKHNRFIEELITSEEMGLALDVQDEQDRQQLALYG